MFQDFINTLKLFQISSEYDLYEDKYYLPKVSKVEYFIKDVKLSNWLKDDVPSIIGAKQKNNTNDDVVKGIITVKYSNYSINKNLPDFIFKKKK